MLDAIARRAYDIFEAKGRIKGRDLDNWLQAEAELFERTPLNIGESQDSVTVLAEVHDFTPKELEIDLEPKRVTIIGRGRTQVEQDAGTSARSQKTLGSIAPECATASRDRFISRNSAIRDRTQTEKSNTRENADEDCSFE
jgi:HSP20 family molecular chaperone IbpA